MIRPRRSLDVPRRPQATQDLSSRDDRRGGPIRASRMVSRPAWPVVVMPRPTALGDAFGSANQKRGKMKKNENGRNWAGRSFGVRRSLNLASACGQTLDQPQRKFPEPQPSRRRCERAMLKRFVGRLSFHWRAGWGWGLQLDVYTGRIYDFAC